MRSAGGRGVSSPGSSCCPRGSAGVDAPASSPRVGWGGAERSGALCQHQRWVTQPRERAHLAKLAPKQSGIPKCSFSEWPLLQAQKNKQNTKPANSQQPRTSPSEAEPPPSANTARHKSRLAQVPQPWKGTGTWHLPTALQFQFLLCWALKRQ